MPRLSSVRPGDLNQCERNSKRFESASAFETARLVDVEEDAKRTGGKADDDVGRDALVHAHGPGRGEVRQDELRRAGG